MAAAAAAAILGVAAPSAALAQSFAGPSQTFATPRPASTPSFALRMPAAADSSPRWSRSRSSLATVIPSAPARSSTRAVATGQQSAPLPLAEIYLGAPLLYREGSGLVLPVEGALTVNLNRWLGITGDVGVEIGEVLYEKPLYTFLAGPTLSLRSGRLRAFAHALAGGAHSGCAEFGERGCVGVVAPSAALGGGIDIRPRRHIALRAQADALLTTFKDETQTFLRLGFGVVIPLGS